MLQSYLFDAWIIVASPRLFGSRDPQEATCTESTEWTFLDSPTTLLGSCKAFLETHQRVVSFQFTIVRAVRGSSGSRDRKATESTKLKI